MITNISLGKSSLHSKTLISLSKPKGLQLQWSNFKHIEELFVKKVMYDCAQFCFIPLLLSINIYSHTDLSF